MSEQYKDINLNERLVMLVSGVALSLSIGACGSDREPAQGPAPASSSPSESERSPEQQLSDWIEKHTIDKRK